jgi:hypothetical protein
MSHARRKPRPQDPDRLALRAQLHPDANGTPAHLIVTLRPGTPVRTRPACRGEATAAYDASGRLLHVEVRGRVHPTELACLARAEPREVRRFLGHSLPPVLVRFFDS